MSLTNILYLTTVDNPFDPSVDFDSWYRYDIDQGYDCCGMLSRFSFTSDSMTDKEFDSEIERAIDEIIKYDPRHVYKKLVVKKEVPAIITFIPDSSDTATRV